MSLYLTYNGQTMYSVGIDRSEVSDFFLLLRCDVVFVFVCHKKSLPAHFFRAERNLFFYKSVLFSIEE